MNKKLTLDTLEEYLNSPDIRNKKELESFLIEALNNGAEIFIKEYNDLEIIAKIDGWDYEIQPGKKYVGIYIAYYAHSSHPNTIHTWVAGSTNGNGYWGGHGLGEYAIQDGYKTVVNKSADRAQCCDYCKKPVGIMNLKHVAFANAVCADCYDQAKKELEYPGWYN